MKSGIFQWIRGVLIAGLLSHSVSPMGHGSFGSNPKNNFAFNEEALSLREGVFGSKLNESATVSVDHAAAAEEIYTNTNLKELFYRWRNPDLVDKYIAQLSSKKRGKQIQAAEYLGQIGDAKAVPELIKKLDDANPDIVNVAIQALGRIGDPQAGVALLGKFHATRFERKTQNFAAQSLGGIRYKEAAPALIAEMKVARNHAEDLYEVLVQSLIQISSYQNPFQKQALTTSNGGVRLRLSESSNSEAIYALLEELKITDASASVKIIKGLSEVGFEEVFQALLQILASERDTTVIQAAIEVIHQWEETRALPALQALHHKINQDPDRTQPVVFRHRKEYETTLNDALSFLQYVDIIDHPEDQIRVNEFIGDYLKLKKTVNLSTARRLPVKKAIQGFFAVHGTRDIRAALKSADPNIRREAAMFLGTWGGNSAVQSLIEALNDTDIRVREQAAIALDNIGNKDAAAPILKAVTEQIRNSARKVGLEDTLTDGERHMMEAVSTLADERVMKALEYFALSGTVEEERQIALETLGKLGDVKYIPLFENILCNQSLNSIQVRLGALRGLRHLKDAAIYQHLIDALYDPNAAIRMAAADTLGDLGYYPAMKDLLKKAIQGVDYRSTETVQRECEVTNHLWVAIRKIEANRLALINTGLRPSQQTIEPAKEILLRAGSPDELAKQQEIAAELLRAAAAQDRARETQMAAIQDALRKAPTLTKLGRVFRQQVNALNAQELVTFEAAIVNTVVDRLVHFEVNSLPLSTETGQYQLLLPAIERARRMRGAVYKPSSTVQEENQSSVIVQLPQQPPSSEGSSGVSGQGFTQLGGSVVLEELLRAAFGESWAPLQRILITLVIYAIVQAIGYLIYGKQPTRRLTFATGGISLILVLLSCITWARPIDHHQPILYSSSKLLRLHS